MQPITEDCAMKGEYKEIMALSKKLVHEVAGNLTSPSSMYGERVLSILRMLQPIIEVQ